MDITRRSLLLGAAGGASILALPGIARGSGAPKHLIMVFVGGGWDVTYSIDPKPGVATIDGPELDESPMNPFDREAVQTFGDVPVMVNDSKRAAVTQFFSQHADKTAVVNGIWVGSVAHQACAVRMLTGARSVGMPDVAMINAFTNGLDAPIPHMDIGNAGFVGEFAAFSGSTGTRNQLKAVLDRSTTIKGPVGSPDYPLYVPSADDEAAVGDYLATRNAAFATGAAGNARSEARVADYLESLTRAQALKDDQTLADNLRYGEFANVLEQAALAVQVIDGGLCHSVAVDSGGAWDSHDDNNDQHGAYEDLFAGLNIMMAELERTGLMSNTVVAVMSEMTRTPKRNADGGKDHWPSTSAMLIGAGVGGGRVYGATDDNLDPVGVDLASGDSVQGGAPAQYDQFVAGILELVGVDPGDWLPDVEAYRGFIA